MRTGKVDYLRDRFVDTIVLVAFLIFECIHSINNTFVNPACLGLYAHCYLL